MRFARYWVLALVVSGGLLGSWSVSAAGIPPAPILYSGDVTLAGSSPPDSVTEHPTRQVTVGRFTNTVVDDHINLCVENCITAVVDGFESVPGIIKNGRYTLTLGVPDSSYTNSDIIFYYEGLVVAEESDNYRVALNSASSAAAVLRPNFTLTFPALPTPTPIPTSTPLPTATPTLTPVPTATPSIPPVMIMQSVGFHARLRCRRQMLRCQRLKWQRGWVPDLARKRTPYSAIKRGLCLLLISSRSIRSLLLVA